MANQEGKKGSKKEKKDKKGTKKKEKDVAVDFSQLPLPSGWEKKYSKEKEKAYYIDHNTRETYWKHPSDPKFKRKQPKGATDDNVLSSNGDKPSAGEASPTAATSAATPRSNDKQDGASTDKPKDDQKEKNNTTATLSGPPQTETPPEVPAESSTDEREASEEKRGELSPNSERGEISESKVEESLKTDINSEKLESLQKAAMAVVEEEAKQEEAEAQKALREAEEKERLRIEAQEEAEAIREAKALAKLAEDDIIEKAEKLEQAESLAKEISLAAASARAEDNQEGGVGSTEDAGKEQPNEDMTADEAVEEQLTKDEDDIFSDEESVPEVYEEESIPCPYNPATKPTKMRKEALKHRTKHSLSSVTNEAKQQQLNSRGASSLSVSHFMIKDVQSPLLSKHSEPLSYTDASIIEDLMCGEKQVLPKDSFSSQTLHNDEEAVRRMQINTNSMLSAANKLRPKALEKVSKTNIYGACKELQVLCNDVKPFMYPEESRKPLSCIKCSNVFNKLTRLKHHCYSCGELYCHDCANNFWQLDIRDSLKSEETAKAYKKPVRVCDYCINHLSAGDLNSVLRYLGVVRVQQTDTEAREAALHGILKSVEWEIQIPLDEKGSGKNVNIVESAYKGLFTAAAQIGGWDIFWQCLLHNLSEKYSGEIRDYTSKIIISIFNRLDSIDTARPFYLQDGVRLLGKCLMDPVCGVSSALALYIVMRAFPLGPLQLAGLCGKEGVLVFKNVIENLRDPDIVPAFRTLLITTVGLVLEAEETSENGDALDSLVKAEYHTIMIEYTKRDVEHYKIALEGLGRLLRCLKDSPYHGAIIKELLDGGIIDSTSEFLDTRWKTLLEEKSYNQVLNTENFYSLAFIEVFSEAFDSHTHLLRKRSVGESSLYTSTLDQVMAILTLLVTDPTDYRASNEGWQILVSTALSIALNLMAYDDFDNFVPYSANMDMVRSCLQLLLMPCETDMFLIHQAVAVLSHYSFDLEFSYTLALLPSSVKEISEICVKIISNSMQTLRGYTAAVQGDAEERQSSSIRRMSATSKLHITTRRYNPSDIMAFSLLSGMLYTSYTAKALCMLPSSSFNAQISDASAGQNEDSPNGYANAEDFFDICDIIANNGSIDEAMMHYLQYILTSLETVGFAPKGATDSYTSQEGASLELKFDSPEEAGTQGFVEGVPVLQFLHTLACCRGTLRSADKCLQGIKESGILKLLSKLLNASFEAREYSILENVLWALGSLMGSPGFFAWEEITLENTYLTLLESGMGEEPVSSSSPVGGISASGDSDDDEASPFVSNEGTEKHRVSSYEKDLLLFARQRASMDMMSSHLYLRDEFKLDNEDESREILASIEEVHTTTRAALSKQDAILAPALACRFGYPVMVAALRVMQGVMRDTDDTIAEGGRGICIKALLGFISHVNCNTMSAIIALDVIDVLTAHPEVWSAAGLQNYSESLNSACKGICTFLNEDIAIIDPIVLMKGMEAVAEMASLRVCHDTISKHLLPILQQIANIFPGNVLLQDQSVNTDSMFRSMLRIVAKLGKNEEVAPCLQVVIPIILRVLPTAEQVLQTDVCLPELQVACMKPSGNDIFYSSRLLTAILTTIVDTIETHEPNLRYVLLHPAITTTGQGIIGQIFDQIWIELPEEMRNSFIDTKECFLTRDSLEPADDWQAEDFGSELKLCLRILYLIAGAHFEPTAENNRLAGKIMQPVQLSAGSLRLGFNLIEDDSETPASKRSYLVYRLLVRIWARGDEEMSLQALTVLARAGCGYEYSTHPERLARDVSKLHIHRGVLQTAPWKQLMTDRQIFLLYELLERAGQMAAGCTLSVGEGRSVKEILTRIGIALGSNGSDNSDKMDNLPRRIVQYEGKEETLYLRVCLEESVGPPGGIPEDGTGTTLGPEYRVPGAMDPSSAYLTQSTACMALRTIVHELRFVPHEKTAMTSEAEADEHADYSDNDENITAIGNGVVESEVRDKHYPAMRAAIISLCRSRGLMDVLQEMTPTIIQACYLFQDITQWPDVLLKYSGLHAVNSLYDSMLTSSADSLTGSTGMAKKVHFTMLSILCRWVAYSHRHPKLRHILLTQLDKTAVCTSLASVLNFHVYALQEGGHDEPVEPTAPALCTFTSVAASLHVVHQILEIFRLFFDHEDGDDEEQVAKERIEEHDLRSVRARTGQAIVRALTVVLAVEQQRLAGDSEYRYETVPHFSHSALNSAVQLLETNNSTKTASEEKDYERSIDQSWSAHEIGVKPGKEEKKNEEDHDQEPLELVDIYPGTPGYPALPTVLRAPNSKPAYPVSDDGAASPDTLKNAENETRRAPSSPWIKSPTPLDIHTEPEFAEETEIDTENEQNDVNDEDIWAVDEDHHEDFVEIDISESMSRLWDLMVALTESPTFIEALLPSTDCGNDPRFGGDGEPLRILEMTVILELLRLGTGIARDTRRHGQDSHLDLIEYCVKVLKNVFTHRPMELIRLLLASGYDLRRSATGDKFAEEEGMHGLEDSGDTEEYCAILTRYIVHVYSTLRHIPTDGERYLNTAFELVHILSTLSANSIPLCSAILSSTAVGSATKDLRAPFDKGAFLVCCADNIVEGCAQAMTARETKRRRIAARRIFVLWKAQKEQKLRDMAMIEERAKEKEAKNASEEGEEEVPLSDVPLAHPEATEEAEQLSLTLPDALSEKSMPAPSPKDNKSEGKDSDSPTDLRRSGERLSGNEEPAPNSSFAVEELTERESNAYAPTDIEQGSPAQNEKIDIAGDEELPRDADAEDLAAEHLEEGEDEVGHMDIWISLLANLCRTQRGRIDVLYYCSPIIKAFLPLLQPMTTIAEAKGARSTKLMAAGAGVHLPGFYLRVSRLRAPNCPLHRTKASFIQLIASIGPTCYGAQGLATPLRPDPNLPSVALHLHSGEQLTGEECTKRMLPYFEGIFEAALACISPEQRDLRLMTMALSVVSQTSGLPSVQDILMKPSTLQALCDLFPRVVAIAPGTSAIVTAVGALAGSRAYLAPKEASHSTLALQATHMCVRLLNTIIIKACTPPPMLPPSSVKLLLHLALTTKAKHTGAFQKKAPPHSGHGASSSEGAEGAIMPLDIVWAPVITHAVEILQTLGLDLYNRDTLSGMCAAYSSGDSLAHGLSLPTLRPLPLITNKKNINSALLMVQIQGLNAYLQPCERPAAVPALYQPSYC